tara:strand:- start:832 stop:1143 length:312 start_codon:yes stop_codon:yes gene_type:complete
MKIFILKVEGNIHLLIKSAASNDVVNFDGYSFKLENSTSNFNEKDVIEIINCNVEGIRLDYDGSYYIKYKEGIIVIFTAPQGYGDLAQMYRNVKFDSVDKNRE